MEVEIRHEYGHYVAFVDGKFFGSYDTASEAARDVDDHMNQTEVA